MHTQTIKHPHANITMNNFVAYNEEYGEKKPAVIIAPDWSGLNDFAKEKAQHIAQLGYVGIALDIYGNNQTGATNEEKSALIQPFLDDRKLLQQRMQAALSFAQSLEQVDSNRIIAIGFCFGGLCVLDLARSGAKLNGVVSFHGLLNQADDVKTNTINAKVLALHGHDDPMVSQEQLAAWQTEMTTAGADWQLHSYGHTLHAFTNPKANDIDFGTLYCERADKRSWQTLLNFMDECFTQQSEED